VRHARGVNRAKRLFATSCARRQNVRLTPCVDYGGDFRNAPTSHDIHFANTAMISDSHCLCDKLSHRGLSACALEACRANKWPGLLRHPNHTDGFVARRNSIDAGQATAFWQLRLMFSTNWMHENVEVHISRPSRLELL
jgi:hypothetical protein